MKAPRLVLAALACALPLLASAQWQWVDKEGRKVFSDQPPPVDVPAHRILRQPGVRGAVAAPPQDAAAAATAAALPRLSGQDKDLVAKKKAAEAAEAAKRKEQEDKIAQAKTDNCSRARQSKAGFDSGVRIARTNAQGEREILDDKQRAEEVKRLEMIIARDCVKAQ